MRVRSAIALLFLLSAGACEGGGEPGVVATPGAASGPTASTQAPSPTPSASELPRTLPECMDPGSAEARGVVLTGDVDGDDEPESVRVWVNPAGPRECRAFLVIEGERTYGTQLEVLDEAVLRMGLPVPMTLGEINGAPGYEAVVTIHRGASTEFAALFTVAGGQLQRLRLRGTPDDLVPLWGSVAHMNGADCASDGRFVTTAAAAKGADRYRVVRIFYRAEGNELVRDEVERSTVRARAINSVPELSGPPFLSCG